ncbi:hypothetical protein [Sphingomonas hankyongi]|uniref:GAF domain-containing protein n=1 Tax=Sphingomonas hankyongi TaxID=2908209 RepID=A0ABT0S3P7_9SPHN|nr:hypothetical protein [Sphingomonas hankyongi]MCL6730484.1 hypothetical protein [Sphingomonas hankyongi]
MTNRSFVYELFYDEPPRAFVEGHVFTSVPDLGHSREDPEAGYWQCDIADHDKLTWSKKVYDLFELPPGTPLEREWAVTRYTELSKAALERVRSYALRCKFGFILDAALEPALEPAGDESRWIRILAVPIVSDGRVVGLHGLKRAL